MRRFSVLITTLAFVLSGLAITPARAGDSNPATAIPVTFGANVQNASREASFRSVSCSSAGNCVAAGSFKNTAGNYEAFTQTQTGGIWATAIPVTFGANVQNANPYSYFNSVSCSSAGNCVAAGSFTNSAGNYEAFTQTQTGGIWATAIPVTFGANVQNASPDAYFNSVSCSSAGNCVAAGEFTNSAGNYEAFTQSITEAIEVPVVTPASEVPVVTPASKSTSTTKFVSFATSSSSLTTAQKAILKKLVTKSGKKAIFVITGEAGKLPGVPDQKVKALASKRGEIVKAYLATLGVSKSKITILTKITNQGIVPKTKILAKYLTS